MCFDLKVFYPNKEKNITLDKMLLILSFSSLAIIIFLFSIKPIYASNLYHLVHLLALFFIVVYVVRGFRRKGKIQTLRGKCSGSIIFSTSKIKIDKNIYDCSEVKSLLIYNRDYRGKPLLYSIDNMLSNGSNNAIIMKFKDNNEAKFYFIQENRNAIKKYSPIFEKYINEQSIYVEVFDF
ncbi:hypothetical protein [Acinetobacter sp. 1000160]|uniref:hypothetical protein n=1 Tax=Acinetobacter sp. 1000160 TaxID=1310800 RepID=UPI0005191215|nr:hypothetical protein [Acinetobacter sp. 1000160]